MSACFVEYKMNNLCVSSQQTTTSKELTMPWQTGIYGIRDYENKILNR